MYSKIKSMSDDDLLHVWTSLCKSTWSTYDRYDDKHTMGEWTEAVYSELNYRRIDKWTFL